MKTALRIALLVSALASFGCATVPRARLATDLTRIPTGSPSEPTVTELATASRALIGTASFYHPSLVGLPTASGEPYSDQALTAAHRTLDLGTRVRVTNLENSRSVVVTVNDRGPFAKGRVIDLSRRAARALGFIHEGLAKVKVEPLS